MKKESLFIFDLDGTLTKKEVLPMLARLIGKQKEMKILTKLGIFGKESFYDNFLKRIEILKDIKIKDAQQITTNIKIDSNFKKFIQENKNSCIVITNNIDLWIQPIIEKLGCRVYSSTAKSKNGKIHKISVLNKETILSRFSQNYIIVIGDGVNDFPLFVNSDVAILYGGVNDASEQLIQAVNYFSRDSEIICRLLKQLL